MCVFVCICRLHLEERGWCASEHAENVAITMQLGCLCVDTVCVTLVEVNECEATVTE